MRIGQAPAQAPQAVHNQSTSAGLAAAIGFGGPGAVFWMWVVAFLGASTAYIESTLGQIYKEVDEGQYRGGPAFYFEKALGQTWYGWVFAVLTVFACGVLLPGVQANAIGNAVDLAVGGGGIPVVKALTEGLAGNEIRRVMGVMNGTCNYILTRMESAGLPYIVSFVISRDGCVLDGTGLETAIARVEAETAGLPLGFTINCAYPAFLDAANQPPGIFKRLIGYQANASSMEIRSMSGVKSRTTSIAWSPRRWYSL